MTAAIVLVDMDGCVRLPHSGRPPVPPPKALGGMFRSLRQVGIRLAVGTGAGLNGVLVTEEHLGFQFDILAASYCGVCVERNGHVARSFLVPDEERAALAKISPQLEQIATKYGGDVTDREGVCFSFHLCRRPQSFTAARAEVGTLVGNENVMLEFRPTEHDLGLVVACTTAHKRRLVDLLRREHEILIGAGDTAADLPMLEAATFPIVTRTQEGAVAHPCLVEVAREKNGYIATRPHGHGLVDGLLAARAAGVINF